MMMSKVSTLTSGALIINDCSFIQRLEKDTNADNVLIIRNSIHNLLCVDDCICAIQNGGYRIVISDRITDAFTVKAVHNGILPIEVSNSFLNKMISASEDNRFKLFIDLKGQEIMIIGSGEKEYFELSDYHKERLEKGNDDIENLYDVWDGLDYSYKYEEITEYALD